MVKALLKARGTAGTIARKPQAISAKSAQKRERVIRAATQLINKKGFALTTMTEIAAALDLRDATLYYYFPSKQALGYACHVASLERIERILLRAHDAEDAGAVRLRHFIQQLLLDGEQHGSHLYFGDYSYLSEGQRTQIEAWSARLETMIEQFLIEGVRDGSIISCDTKLVANLLIGMLISLARWTWRVKDITIEHLMEAIDAASLSGLDPR